jgi:glycerol dehydrogenase-like iron-containing ADH family enzyme
MTYVVRDRSQTGERLPEGCQRAITATFQAVIGVGGGQAALRGQ